MDVPDTMRAAVIYEVGGPEQLRLETRPIPEASDGQALVRIEAFGLNRSEMFTRLGHSKKVVTFPRILGIECVGVVARCPSGKYAEGQQAAVIMGGLGRKFDGGYAEYTLVPEDLIIPFASDLPWHVIGAVPEMCQTASGSLDAALDLRPGETLLIRGGTSSVGMTAAQLAKIRGCTVLSTSRSERKAQRLREIGVDHVIIDDGEIAETVRALVPGGVDKVLELVGGDGIRDSLRCCRPKGVVCQTGYLSGDWRMNGFSPLGEIPSTVRLTAYSGGNDDLPHAALQEFLDNVAAGALDLAIDAVFTLDQIVEAHEHMENDRATGKLVVVNGEPPPHLARPRAGA